MINQKLPIHAVVLLTKILEVWGLTLKIYGFFSFVFFLSSCAKEEGVPLQNVPESRQPRFSWAEIDLKVDEMVSEKKRLTLN